MIELKPEDLIITHMQPENVGGWSIGTPKGITLYHKPSDVEVSIDRYRSQHRNRAACLEVLQDLLTPFEVGDIIVTEDGIGEVTTLGRADRIHYDLGDKNSSNCWIGLVSHTEHGYIYKNSQLILSKIDDLTETYNSKVALLRNELKELNNV